MSDRKIEDQFEEFVDYKYGPDPGPGLSFIAGLLVIAFLVYGLVQGTL